MSSTTGNPQAETNSLLVDRLLPLQAKFAGFLRARVSDVSDAEDILQLAYIKAIEHGAEIKDEESTVAWFYRILRNAITDHHRRKTVRDQARDSFAAETLVSYEADLKQTVCTCIGNVLQQMKSEYRQAIEEIDLGETSIPAFAAAHATSVNNVSVRLHRARKDVAARLTAVCGICAHHKCLDCTCRSRRV